MPSLSWLPGGRRLGQPLVTFITKPKNNRTGQIVKESKSERLDKFLIAKKIKLTSLFSHPLNVVALYVFRKGCMASCSSNTQTFALQKFSLQQNSCWSVPHPWRYQGYTCRVSSAMHTFLERFNLWNICKKLIKIRAIREKYYKLAKQLHPDSSESKSPEELQKKQEEFGVGLFTVQKKFWGSLHIVSSDSYCWG